MTRRDSLGTSRNYLPPANIPPFVLAPMGLLLVMILATYPAAHALAQQTDNTAAEQSCPYFDLPTNAAADWSTCSTCHSQEAQRYAGSTHGTAPSEELPFEVQGPALTQTCGDCHLPERGQSETDTQLSFKLTACDTCHPAESQGLQADIHTEKGVLACTSCHDAHTIARGKDEATAVTARCTQCHLGAAQGVANSPHGKVQEDGYTAALCSDCHNPHQVQLLEEPRARAVAAVETCTRCHDGDVARSYAFSFHGTALRLGEQNVATCVDCHGHHGIKSFDTSVSSTLPVGVQLAQTCGQSGCHTGSGVKALPADYKEHVVPQESAVLPVRFTWKFFIILILFDTLKDGPITMFELIRTLINDARARLSRRRGGEVT